MAARRPTAAEMAASRNAEQVREVADLVVRRPAIRKAGSDPFREIGTTGLRQFGGFVLEEWLQSLAGRKAAWVYREMQDNDPTIGAVLFAIRWLATGVEWRVDEGNDPAAAELVESSMHDMSHTWGDLISEVLSMLPYGWAFHEQVFKVCKGQQPERTYDPANEGQKNGEDDSNPASSAYDDGKIRWRKLPIRAQETLLRWHFDGVSGLRAMEQVDWHGSDNVIPIEKALLFRTQTTRNNPEGRSILRNAYTSYFAIKNIRQLEAIGIERDLAGIPVATPPPDIDLFAPSRASLLQKVQEMVTSIRRDEYEGIVLPTDGWKLELLRGAGARQIDTDAVVRRYRQDIAASMLADWVLIGMDAVGSYAMVDVKSDLFGLALDGILDLVCEVFNRYAIPRLLRLNGMDASEPPRIAHGSAGRLNLEKVGDFFNQLYLAGAPIPWSQELLSSLFTEAGLPANFDEQTPMKGDLWLPPGAKRPGEKDGQQALDDSERTGAQEADTDAEEDAARAQLQKAEHERVGHGTAIAVAPHLAQRARHLSAQLQREIDSALAQLGEKAATAYLSSAQKASAPAVHRLVGRVMRALDLRRWVREHLDPLLVNHAGRVAADTQRTLQAEIGLELTLGEEEARTLAAQAGAGLGMADIEPQVRAAILQAVKDAVAAGENPTATAQRIRSQVPAGRFTHAGSRYRSQLIARDQTARLQRAATLALYQSNPRISHIRLRDGIYGPPRSDGQCMGRDGEVLPIDDVGEIHANHPLCTLGLEPVVTGVVRPPAPEPIPALAA